MKIQRITNQIKAVDIFCGIGGLSFGLINSGIEVVAGIDIDPTCQYAFEENCKAKFICESIENISNKQLENLYNGAKFKILTGCAPCQPFSNYTLNADKTKDNRWHLLEYFSKLIEAAMPDIVSMENVPQLATFKHSPVFPNFINSLKKLGYFVTHKIVFAPDYGIPQKRKRLVLLASKHGEIELIQTTHKKENYITVRDVIGDLEKIKSGSVSKSDFLHRASKLSDLNTLRIKQSKPGGSWKTDWNEELLLSCHRSQSGATYGSMYGRMKWDEPSPTMTTHCTGLGNGRFGHPEQDRAITLREASLLQTFPITYKFCKDQESLSVRNISKHIGNAVPPKLGEIIGLSIIDHLKKIK